MPAAPVSPAPASPRGTAKGARSTAPRKAAARSAVPTARPLPRFVVPISTILALGLGSALARPLFERVWLPRVPLERVAVIGTSVRDPRSIAQALRSNLGNPIDRIDPKLVAALVLADPWIESAESFRLPTGTLLVRVVERRAVARYQREPLGEVALLDPTGRPFLGAIEAGGALPLVEGPLLEGPTDGDSTLPATVLEILEELRRHEGLAADPTALTLYLPGSTASADPASGGAAGFDSLAGESGYVLELGREGPRALLGQSFLKRRIARLATLLMQRDVLLAGARVIDLRYAGRAVLRNEPTSG
jgi:cell division septal protein FtsQ